MTTAVAVSGGETPTSKTRRLAEVVVGAAGGDRVIDLSELSAAGLLGRSADPAVDEAVAAVGAADVVVLASPIYRATVSGAVKGFLDRFATDAFRGKVVVLVATAATPQHYLALDTGGRALVASLGGTSAPTVVYGTSADFVDGQPGPELAERATRAGREAVALSGLLVAGS